MPSDVPRLRMFAGPNGSGKTSAYEWVRSDRPDIPWGVYVNADLIADQLESRSYLDLAEWNLSVDDESLPAFAAQSGWDRQVDPNDLPLTANVLRPNSKGPATYVAAVIADWIRSLLLEQRLTFTTETVMSHAGKLELLRRAHECGYRTYLYFVATENPAINLRRIARRTEKGGHTVPEVKVTERYTRSLALLPQAIALADRAYLFDNTDTLRLFVEYEQGRLRQTFGEAPAWSTAISGEPGT